MKRRVLPLALAAIAAQAAGFAHAQDAWPNRAIKIVTPSPAGVGSDAFARLYADQLSKALGVGVIVENRPGAAGTLGTDYVSKSVPDGYTVLLTTSLPMTAVPHLFKKVPYSVASDFSPVAQLYRGGSFLVASPSFQGTTIKDLLSRAKQKPGQVSYASYGTGSTAHLGMELLQDAAGVELLHIPYKQNAMIDVSGGQVDVGFEPPVSALPNIKAGRLKALAYTGDKRSPALPDVPTLAELYPGLEVFTWVGVWAPRATPAPILARLRSAFTAATKTADMQKSIIDVGNDPMSTTPAQMQANIDQESVRYAKLIKAKNIRLD
ncbi:MAG: tripartite tricarboxylate transporter substrate binding protein [Pseudomonadota bacterium]